MSMTDETWAVLEALDKATEEGRVAWKLTANPTEVAVAFSDSSLILSVEEDERDSMAALRFLDSSGDVFEHYTTTPTQDYNSFERIYELHKKASRNARNVGPKLKSILEQLKAKAGR